MNVTAIFSVPNDINRIRMQPWNLCISDIYTFYGQFFILFIWKFDCHWINEQHIGWISDVVMKSQGGAKLLKHAVVKARHAWDNESKVLVFRMLGIDKRIRWIEVMSRKGC